MANALTVVDPLYAVVDPSGFHLISRSEILNWYGKHWKHSMYIAGKGHMVSDDRCVEDFIVVHWAWEISR